MIIIYNVDIISESMVSTFLQNILYSPNQIYLYHLNYLHIVELCIVVIFY